MDQPHCFKNLRGFDNSANTVYFLAAQDPKYHDSNSSSCSSSPVAQYDVASYDAPVSERQEQALKRLNTGNTWLENWKRQKPPAGRMVIYFPGDGQLPFGMNDDEPFAQWNLDDTLTHLSATFPSKHILVIAPVQNIRKRTAIYGNMTPLSESQPGVPCHRSDLVAVAHLCCLLDSLQIELRKKCAELHPMDSWGEVIGDVDIERGGLDLVGFSRGCIVLNQLLFELAKFNDLKTNKKQNKFVGRISSMTWLDGGHEGPQDTWVTDHTLLFNALVLRHISVNVLLTNYQINDRKPTIVREERIFSDYLSDNLTAPFKRYCYTTCPTLQEHFAILNKITEG